LGISTLSKFTKSTTTTSTKETMMNERNKELVNRITEYLSLGGFFNPELMDHEKVRDLLIECRKALCERTN
jgi:hypothetical protein